MKSILVLILLNTSNVFSQEYQKLPEAKTGSETYLLNDCVLGNERILYSFDMKDLKSVQVIKDTNECECYDYKNIPINLLQYKLIHIQFNSKIETKTQPELNTFFGLDINTPIYLDGFLIDNSYYEIAISAIVEIERIKPNEYNKLEEEVLNIWTLKKDKRELPVFTKK